VVGRRRLLIGEGGKSPPTNLNVKFETWRNVRWVGPQGSEAFFRETEKNREKSGETGIKIFRGPLDVSGDAGWRDPQ
jgi:hypothetical protein